MAVDSPLVQDIDADLRRAQETKAALIREISALVTDMATLDLTVDGLLDLRARAVG